MRSARSSCGATLYTVPILSDNYSYILEWEGGSLAIDPGEAEPLLAYNPTTLLITHHHYDHTGGIKNFTTKEHGPKKEGCEERGPEVIGPNDPRIPKLSYAVTDEETFQVGPCTFQAIETPGHTRPHLAYYMAKDGWLFTGDALFGAGCGRLFEGDAAEMFASLQRLAVLPDTTEIYCGHEYTIKNLEFAATVEPNNGAIKERLKNHVPGEPSTIALEKATNPFLRCKDAATFALIREKRNLV